MTWSLLAQIDPQGLAGGSGWLGAGLLGLVLAWLLFVHLPSRDKRDKEKDDLLMKVIADKDAHIERITSKFREALDTVIEHCRSEMALAHKSYHDLRLPPIDKKGA